MPLVRIQVRRDTEENWTSADPILADGEVGYQEGMPGRLKVGNGSSHWSELPFTTAATLDELLAPAADVDFGGHRLTDLGDATADTDALNRRIGDARYDAAGTSAGERSRATTAEAGLSSAIDTEVSRAEAAEATKMDAATTLDEVPVPGAAVDLNGQKLTNVGDAAAATDALNRETADGRYDAIGSAASAQAAAEAASDPAGSADAAQAASLQKADDLSDLASASAARTNLGLGSAATHASTDFDAAGTSAAETTRAEAAEALAAQKANNLSDLASTSSARTNLGLGSAATHASTDFDPAGAAATAQANAEAASDPAGSAATAQTNAIAASAQGLAPTALRASAYTAAPADFVPVSLLSGSVPITLPTAPPDKTRIGVKVVKVDAAHANSCTVAAGGTDVFNVAGGSTTLALTALFQGVLLQYKASTGIWYVSTADTPLGQANGGAQLDSTGRLPIAQTALSVVNGSRSQARSDLKLDYLAVGDGQVVTDASMGALNTTLTCATSTPFKPSDVGKSVLVPGAGAGGGSLVSTIASYTDGAHVNLTDGAQAGVTGALVEWGTDDTAAILRARDAMAAGAGTCTVADGIYIIAGAFQAGNKIQSQVLMPSEASTAGSLTSGFVGYRRPFGMPPSINLGQPLPNDGAVFSCHATPTGAQPSVIGWDGPSAGFTTSMGVLDGITVRCPPQSNMTGVDLSWAGSCDIGTRLGVRVGVLGYSTTTPQPPSANANSYGMRFPKVGNEASVRVGRIDVSGFTTQVSISEHFTAQEVNLSFGQNGLEVASGYLGAQINSLCTYSLPNHIVGTATTTPMPLVVEKWAAENDGLTQPASPLWCATSAHLYAASGNKLQVLVKNFVNCNQGGPNLDTGPVQGGTGTIQATIMSQASPNGLYVRGLELAASDLASNPAGATTALADTGLSITFTAPPGPFRVWARIPLAIIAAASGDLLSLTLTDGSGTILDQAEVGGTEEGLDSGPVTLTCHLPRTGGANAYAITPGQSYTFKLRQQMTAGTGQIQTNSGQYRPQMWAVAC